MIGRYSAYEYIKIHTNSKEEDLVASNVIRQLINLAPFYIKVYWQFLREYGRAIFTLHNDYAPRWGFVQRCLYLAQNRLIH